MDFRRSRRIAAKLDPSEAELDESAELFSEPFDPTLSLHHELLAELLEDLPAAIDPSIVTWLSSCEFLGHSIVPGQWLFVRCKVRRATFLANVKNVFVCDGHYFVTACSYTPSEVMFVSSEDQLQSAKEEDLESMMNHCVRT